MKGRNIDVRLLTLLCITIFVVILDTSYTRLFDLPVPTSNVTIIAFVSILCAYSIVLCLLLQVVRTKTLVHLADDKKLAYLHIALSMSIYAMIALTSFIVVSIIVVSLYSVSILSAILWISYAWSIAILGFIVLKFLLWFRSGHNTTVLIYAMAISALCINCVFVLLYVTQAFENVPKEVSSYRNPLADFNRSETFFLTGLNISNLLSFFLTWIAAATLLHHYSNKIGRLKYWIVIALPLLYFVSQFESIVSSTIVELQFTEPVLYYFITTFVNHSAHPIGGILFGISFLLAARHVGNSALRESLKMSGLGIMLLFSSNNSGLSLVSAPYPPFSIGAVWLVCLSSYLLLIGIYSSAVSIARDKEFRHSIRKSIENQMRLLHSIGTSEMENQIQKQVLHIAKRSQIEAQTDTSLDEADIKLYIEEVLQELKKGQLKDKLTKADD